MRLTLDELEKELPARLYLKQEGSSIYLMAQNLAVVSNAILEIKENGTIRRCNAVSRSLNFQLDDARRVVMTGEPAMPNRRVFGISLPAPYSDFHTKGEANEGYD